MARARFKSVLDSHSNSLLHQSRFSFGNFSVIMHCIGHDVTRTEVDCQCAPHGLGGLFLEGMIFLDIVSSDKILVGCKVFWWLELLSRIKRLPIHQWFSPCIIPCNPLVFCMNHTWNFKCILMDTLFGPEGLQVEGGELSARRLHYGQLFCFVVFVDNYCIESMR